MEPRAYRRKVPRLFVEWPAVVLVGIKRLPCMILNVSPGGAKLEFAREVPEDGQVILVSHKLGSIAGCVVWRRDLRVGIKFAEQSAPELKAAIKNAMGPSPGFGRRVAVRPTL